MYAWKRLDLRKAESRPRTGRLVALHMTPNNERATFYREERYDIGSFREDERSKSKKLWWHGSHGVNDVLRLKQHYDIWWCPVAEFDGGGQAL